MKLNWAGACMSIEDHRKESKIKDALEESKEGGGDGLDTQREFQETRGMMKTRVRVTDL